MSVEYNLLRPTSAPLFFRYPLLSRTNPRIAIIVRRCTPTPCGAAPAETMTSRQASRRHIIFGHRRNRNDCEHRKYTESPQTVDTEGIAQNSRFYALQIAASSGTAAIGIIGHLRHIGIAGIQCTCRIVMEHSTNYHRACTTKHAVFPTSPLKTLLNEPFIPHHTLKYRSKSASNSPQLPTITAKSDVISPHHGKNRCLRPTGRHHRPRPQAVSRGAGQSADGVHLVRLRICRLSPLSTPTLLYHCCTVSLLYGVI